MSNHSPEQPTNPGIETQNPTLFASLRESFDTFWAELPDRSKRFDADKKKARMFGVEVAFIDKVYSAITKLATDHEGPITILFDVDETLVKNNYDSDTSYTTYVRPGLDILLSALDDSLGDRYDIGLLTSRGQNHLEEELLSPTYLKKIADHINPDFVISSREGSPIYDNEILAAAPAYSMHGRTASLALKSIRNIIKPELADAVRADNLDAIFAIVDRSHWYDGKLAILDHLAQQNPDRGFVFVDDLPFPASIDTAHPQVRGVALGDASFSV